MGGLRKFVRSIPVVGDALAAAKGRFVTANAPEFRNSAQYWEDRYSFGGNSGAGSYNRLAAFKAEIINQFVRDHSIKSVVEFGVGDGAQLALADYPSFVGIDVSQTIVDKCRSRFAGDPTKQFYVSGQHPPLAADLSLSLDVIYHLVEDPVFETYMTKLFEAATRHVIVYASDMDQHWPSKHVRHRNFTRWIDSNISGWRLRERIPNRYPYDPNDQDHTSFADFYIFERS